MLYPMGTEKLGWYPGYPKMRYTKSTPCVCDILVAELFFNDGAQAVTTILYNPQHCDSINWLNLLS